MDAIRKKIFKSICLCCIALITLYQYSLSPLFKIIGVQCRFYPSCSAYAKIMFREHNFFKALYLTTKRLLCCNPYFQKSTNKKG